MPVPAAAACCSAGLSSSPAGASSGVPQEKPWGITFHLFSEFSTATLLIVSGVASLLNMDWAKSISLIALGMLMYIVIYSPGYYLQKKNKPMALMFVALIILTATAITATLMFT